MAKLSSLACPSPIIRRACFCIMKIPDQVRYYFQYQELIRDDCKNQPRKDLPSIMVSCHFCEYGHMKYRTIDAQNLYSSLAGNKHTRYPESILLPAKKQPLCATPRKSPRIPRRPHPGTSPEGTPRRSPRHQVVAKL